MPSKAKQIFHFVFGLLFLASCIYLAYSIFDEFGTVENDIFEYHEPNSEDFLPRTYPLPDVLEVPEQEDTER